jgi:p-aminobenzoyl-glutamate transporter AbgT
MHDATLWPYRSGNAVVDVVLFIVWGVLFGMALGWGMRISNKLP